MVIIIDWVSATLEMARGEGDVLQGGEGQSRDGSCPLAACGSEMPEDPPQGHFAQRGHKPSLQQRQHTNPNGQRIDSPSFPRAAPFFIDFFGFCFFLIGVLW